MESTARLEHSQPNGLLAALVPFGVLVQPEVALTRSICWLLGLEGASPALDGLVRRNGLDPEANGMWLTEVVGDDRGRTDLEYRWGDPPMTRVVVEAKLGHSLTSDQIEVYSHRLPSAGGLIVVLLPESRRTEGEQVLREYRRRDPDGPVALGHVRVDMWTYDDVTAALEEHLPGSPDLAQFRGLVQASNALAVFPLTESELLDNDPTRRQDIWRVVDSASFGLFGKRLPSGSDWSLDQRRYVELVPYSVGLAVGVGRRSRVQNGTPQPWAWIRLSDGAPFSRVARSVLEDWGAGLASRDSDGSCWLPLDIPTQTSGSVMIKQVRAEIERIGTAIRDEIDRAADELDTVPTALKDSVTAVLGIEPIEPFDLLDESETRRADIELILSEAWRSTVGRRKLNPAIPDDDYRLNRYLSVPPLATNVSTSVGRRAPSSDGRPQPWAWLRVHADTPHAEAAYTALEQVAPSRVVIDPHGRAIPFDIPDGVNGPAMLAAVHDQLHRAMAAIRAAVRSTVPSALEQSPNTSASAD